MKQTDVICPTLTARDATARARRQLGTGSVRLSCVLATLLCLTFWVGTIYVCESAFYALDWESFYEKSHFFGALARSMIYVLDGLIVILIDLPILYGTLSFYRRAATGEDASFAELFRAFGSGRAYRRTVCLMFLLCLRYLLIGGVIAAILFYAKEQATLWITVVGALVGAAVLLFGWVLLGREEAVLPLALRNPRADLFTVFRASHRMTRGNLWRIWGFKMRFIGWAVLSVLSVFILAVYHGIPYYALSHVFWLDSFPQNDLNFEKK